MNFKVGDKIIVNGDPNEMFRYGLSIPAGSKGTIIEVVPASLDRLQRYADVLPQIKPHTKQVFFVCDNGNDWWAFDFHVALDVDSLPYHEWVKRRDWNKVYKDQSERIMRSIVSEP
jgi:hypothetical protein